MSYLDEAQLLAVKRLESLKLLLESATVVSQEKLAEFVSFVIDLRLLNNGNEKYSYVVKGVAYEN